MTALRRSVPCLTVQPWQIELQWRRNIYPYGNSPDLRRTVTNPGMTEMGQPNIREETE
jgi:hypothetical protein